MIDQYKLENAIGKAKRLISNVYLNKDESLIGLVSKWNREVCLVVAEFKCQKCGTEENLTLHHLIMRKAKDFMDFWRYISQRYYWANQIILCKECHLEYHGVLGEDSRESMLVISDKTINKLKKKYEIKTK
jgi:5-methylcytosine-specific restriction endonuclease McrA